MSGTARVVWFVHRPDLACLRWSVRQAMRAFPDGTTFHVFADGRTGGLHARSAEWLTAAGVQYAETDWDRGGNLNGLEAVQGILRAMGGCAQGGDDVVWKLDADTLVGDPGVLLEAFADPNLVGAGLRCPWAPGWWGISYALRAAVIAPLSAVIGSNGEAGLAQIGLSQAHEDLVISRTLARYEPPSRLRTWMTRRTGGAFCAHNYETGGAGRQALHRWGIVTFGNRWQIQGDDAIRRQMVAKSMGQAVRGWRPAAARAWRNASTEALWMRGALLRFGKSSGKGASNCTKTA
jgi:hypothetical protein